MNHYRDNLASKLRREADYTLQNILIYAVKKKNEYIPKVFIHKKGKKHLHPFGLERL